MQVKAILSLESIISTGQNGHHYKVYKKKKKNAGDGVFPLHYWWECQLVQPLRKTEWRLLKKLKIKLPYDLLIPFLGIYPEKINLTRYMHPYVRRSIIYNNKTWK